MVTIPGPTGSLWQPEPGREGYILHWHCGTYFGSNPLQVRPPPVTGQVWGWLFHTQFAESGLHPRSCVAST